MEVKISEYIKLKEIELKIASNIVKTMILPAVCKQISYLSDCLGKLQNSGIENEDLKVELVDISDLYSAIVEKHGELLKIEKKTGTISDDFEKSQYLAASGVEGLNELRKAVDQAESMVADDLWPYSKYQELLTKL